MYANQDFHHITALKLLPCPVLNDFHLNTDSGKISVLDLSAAFDTVDHNIPLEQSPRNLQVCSNSDLF